MGMAVRVVVLLGVLTLVTGKFIRATAYLAPSSAPYALLTGFSMNPGSGSLQFKARPSASLPSYQLALYFVRSDSSLPTYPCTPPHNTTSLTSLLFPLTSNPVSLTLPSHSSPDHYLFYLAICNTTSDPLRLKYTLAIQGPASTQITIEEFGLEDWLSPLCLLYGLVAAYASYKLIAAFRMSDDLEGGLVLIVFAMVVEVISMVFAIIDIGKMTEDGKGWGIFRFFGVFGDMSAQSFVVIILLCVASGYYIKSTEFPYPELIIYPSLLYLLFLTGLLICDQLSEPYHFRDSSLKDIYGKLEIIGKIGLLMWTLRMVNEIKGASDMRKVMTRIRKICYLAYGNTGLGYLCSRLVPVVLRYKVFVVVSRGTMAAAVVWLLSLLAPEEGYRKVEGCGQVLPSSKSE